METETDKIIKNQLQYLPKEIIGLFSSPNTSEKISEIGNSVKLNTEQLDIFEMETSLLMLGFTNPDDYKNELKTRLAVPEENIASILKEVHTFIPDELIKELKLVYEENEEEASHFDQSFSVLPEKIQLAIANSDWKEKLYTIAARYKLTIPQMGDLEEITKKVIKNEIRADKYMDALVAKIPISSAYISNITSAVNMEVLSPIRELMQNTPTNSGVEVESRRVEINIDEEIPLPPYKKVEEKIDIPVPPVQVEVKKEPEAPKPEIKVENISEPKEEPKNIIEEKLKGATISKHDISNYSIPKVTTPEVEGRPKSFDPYREAF